MRKTNTIALGAAVMAIVPSVSSAQDLLPPESIPGELSANMALSTDYVFRGVSQSDRGPSLSGGLDYSLDTGIADVAFYAGVWGANVQQTYEGKTANIELDYYAGLSGSLPGVDGLGWDVGVIQYDYPGAAKESEFDLTEYYGSLSYDFGLFGLGTGLAYSPDYFGGIGESLYVSVDAEIPVHESIYIAGSFGRLMDLTPNSGKEFDQFNNWSAGIGATVLGFDWSATYYDTSGYGAGSKEAEGGGKSVVGSVAASF